MCIEFTGEYITTEEEFCYKDVRIENGKMLSLIPPEYRLPHHLNSMLPGLEIEYELNKTYNSGYPGFYCYTTFINRIGKAEITIAVEYLDEMTYPLETLKCLIPIGTKVLMGSEKCGGINPFSIIPVEIMKPISSTKLRKG